MQLEKITGHPHQILENEGLSKDSYECASISVWMHTHGRAYAFDKLICDISWGKNFLVILCPKFGSIGLAEFST